MTDYYFYPAKLLTGGGDGAVDAIDGSLLKDGDAAFVVLAASRTTYVYSLNATSGATDDGLNVIAPDANAGLKRWVLTNSPTNANEVTFYGATGNGTTDDRDAIAAADAGVTGYVHYAPGSYKIASDITITTPIVMEPGALFVIPNGVTLTISGAIHAGLTQIFSCTGTGNATTPGKVVYPEWWGAKADDSTACTTAFSQCITSAVALRSGMKTQTLLLSDGIYRVTATSGNYAVDAWCPIKGVGPNDSVIKNVGAGSAMQVNAAYYSRFENFSVIGNTGSEDGIVLGPDHDVATAYMQLSHVDSTNHGRDGLRVVHAWGTKFMDCKFSSNVGLGVHCLPDAAHPGTKNAHVFRDCEARWNGGVTDNTGVYTKGGVLITNANGVFWHGGVVESNNAWGFIIGTDSAANNLISLQNVYMENNPPSASEAAVDVPTTIGGSIYVDEKHERVEVSGCYIAYGGVKNTQTGYAFYIAHSPENYSYFKEWGNHTVPNGGAGVISRDAGIFMDWTKPYVSNPLVPGTYDLYFIDEATDVSCSGVIHMAGKIGTASAGVYPFIFGYNTTGGNYLSVGACIAGTGAVTPPSIAYVGATKKFQITIAADERAHVELRIHGKQANSLHSFSLISSSGVWNEDFIKRAN